MVPHVLAANALWVLVPIVASREGFEMTRLPVILSHRWMTWRTC